MRPIEPGPAPLRAAPTPGPAAQEAVVVEYRARVAAVQPPLPRLPRRAPRRPHRLLLRGVHLGQQEQQRRLLLRHRATLVDPPRRLAAAVHRPGPFRRQAGRVGPALPRRRLARPPLLLRRRGTRRRREPAAAVEAGGGAAVLQGREEARRRGARVHRGQQVLRRRVREAQLISWKEAAAAGALAAPPAPRDGVRAQVRQTGRANDGDAPPCPLLRHPRRRRQVYGQARSVLGLAHIHCGPRCC